LEIKEDLFSWENIYPVLHPQPVLETLMALWDYAAELFFSHKYASLECKAGKLVRVLKHPSYPPPPPPCQLDGVEYELETTSIINNVMDERDTLEPEECALLMAINQNEIDKYAHKKPSQVNITYKHPFPDLVPEGFDNIQMNQWQNLVDYNEPDGTSRDNSRFIETWFLVTMLICTLLLLYLSPSQNS
jgi:hypothetical protein